MPEAEVTSCGANKDNDAWGDISFRGVGGWLAVSCREWCILLHDSLMPSLCLAHAAFPSLCGPQGSLSAAVARLSSGCAGCVGWRAVPASAVFSCLKYSKIKNWMSWIQHEDGLLPSLKLIPAWFACPINGKKTELPLNSLDKTQWHLCLCIWSFKVLWLHVAVLQCSLDFSSALYCCGWSQALIYPDPMQTEVL